MKRICERGLNWCQIYDDDGNVRQCSWTVDGHIGNLQDNTMYEIYHGERAESVRNRLLKGDYSLCKVDACPYLAMNDLENHMIEYEKTPEYPSELYLGFERVCNYACTCCTVHQSMKENKAKELEKKYSKIEERILPLLPHVKKISANGCGELFCSKHILNLLANWKPLANPEEVEVLLESNGSLFDETHWKQIENLGQYNLRVAISVMSFDEPVYQYLSGTKLPITKVENNLKFIKSLREKGIINYFEIATVVQEQNFRSMPAFVHKCIEEYQPDYIRLRPYASWGAQSPEEVWITDVRNPQHPYYTEYKKVMQHPVLNHPIVHDWSGGLDTVNRTNFPYKAEALKFQILLEMSEKMKDMCERLRLFSQDKNVAIYGASVIGKTLADKLQEYGYIVEYMIDRNSCEKEYKGIPIVSLQCAEKNRKDLSVIVTPILKEKFIFDDLEQNQYTKVISIKDLVVNEKTRCELKGLL